MTKQLIISTVEVLNEQATFTLHELCERGGVHAEFIIELVDYGIIAPLKEGPPSCWAFDTAALARLYRVLRLQRDLEINLPGIAMSLDLLDEVNDLRQQVELLNQLLKRMLGD